MSPLTSLWRTRSTVRGSTSTTSESAADPHYRLPGETAREKNVFCHNLMSAFIVIIDYEFEADFISFI